MARAEKQRVGQEVWLGGDLITFCSPKAGLPGAPRGPTEGKQREKVAFAEPHLDVFSGRGRLVTGNLGMLSPDASQPLPALRAQGRRKKGVNAGLPQRNSGTPCRRRGIPSPQRTAAPTILLPGRAATKSLRPGRQGRLAPLGERPEGPPARPPRFLSGLAGAASTSGSFRSAVCARGAAVRRGWPAWLAGGAPSQPAG